MPFDPTLPLQNTEIDAVQMRAQLNGLKELIDAVPAGPPGPQGVPGVAGPQGPPFAEAVVNGVSTLDPGQEATVEVTFDGTAVHFSFAIPSGVDGPPGPPGEVTAAEFAGAISNTAVNPSETNPFMGSFSEPPTAGEVQALADKLNELIAVLRRG